ncbi:MAG TPA: SET domain-containing protein-lysine N-methyltransferase, partial [Chitinophagaceae bacterium]|nr:SET domain-containing protein-lysine N-methyltransferase [Chitinophagaceae bacterium]
MIHTSFLQIKNSKFGNGLFATKGIRSNTIICTATGPVLTFEETIQLNNRESHCLQIEKDKYLLCDAPFLYTNHSCDPNCGLNNKLQLVTLRNINKDEELFWDYSTSMLERHWTMQCHCGSLKCRHLITDFDLLPDDVQQ